MARRGWSTANFLRYAGAVVSAYPLTMACWCKTSVLATNQKIMGLFASGSAFNATGVPTIEIRTDNKLDCASGASTTATTGAGIASGVWFHACGVFASAASMLPYFNGVAGVSAAGSALPALNRTSIGVGDGSSASTPWAPAGTGDLAEAAFWNIALSATDVAALAKGVSPLLIHPEALVGYWPLIGAYSPENNLVSNTSVLSVQGTLTAAAHPRVFMPATGRARWFSSSTPPVTPSYSWQSSSISPPPPRASKLAAQTPTVQQETFSPLGWQSAIVTPPLRRTTLRADMPMQDWPFVPLYWPSVNQSARSRLATSQRTDAPMDWPFVALSWPSSNSSARSRVASSQRADTPMQPWPFTALGWQASVVTTVPRKSSTRADIIEQPWPFETPMAWQSASIATPPNSIRRFSSLSAQVPARFIQVTTARVTSSAFIIH